MFFNPQQDRLPPGYWGGSPPLANPWPTGGSQTFTGLPPMPSNVMQPAMQAPPQGVQPMQPASQMQKGKKPSAFTGLPPIAK